MLCEILHAFGRLWEIKDGARGLGSAALTAALERTGCTYFIPCELHVHDDLLGVCFVGMCMFTMIFWGSCFVKGVSVLLRFSDQVCSST